MKQFKKEHHTDVRGKEKKKRIRENSSRHNS